MIALLSAAAVATPALGREGSAYAGGEIGATRLKETNFDILNGVATVEEVDHETGYDAALFAGYDFGMFRLEAEVAQKRASVDEAEFSGAMTGRFPGGGSTRAQSFMVNGLIDIGDDGGFGAFVGGGLGIARVKANDYRVADGPVVHDDSDSAFALQAIAGIRAAIGERLDAHIKYRFFNVDDISFAGIANAGSPAIEDGRLRSHSVLAGIAFSFGGRAGGPGQ